MASSSNAAPSAALTEAVRASIVGAAHAAAFERVAAARQATRRLGELSAGRWRAASRDLERLEKDLETALQSASEDLERRATQLGVTEESLWTVGDAAAVFDVLRDETVESLEEGDGAASAAAARLLESDALLGVTLLEDPDAPNRGSTLLFGWADPLKPAVWPWETNWVVASDSTEPGEEELELYAVGDLDVSEPLFEAVRAALGSNASPDEARTALEEVAAALTRMSLLAAADEGAPETGAGDETD